MPKPVVMNLATVAVSPATSSTVVTPEDPYVIAVAGPDGSGRIWAKVQMPAFADKRTREMVPARERILVFATHAAYKRVTRTEADGTIKVLNTTFVMGIDTERLKLWRSQETAAALKAINVL